MAPEADKYSGMAERLNRWAEITELAIELRKAVLSLRVSRAEAEGLVWREIREAKEKAWTTAPS